MVVEEEAVKDQFAQWMGGGGAREGYAIPVRCVIRGGSSCPLPQVFGRVSWVWLG